MNLTRLRLVGFKTFVEPTEFLIEPGLTGIVGPNGCGKSNLVEALRWVMGESSFKNMRASGMDDVIFAGSGDRPARNTAEVALHARQHRPQRARPPSTTPTSSTSRAGSSARRARPIASTARRCAPATCSCSSPTPPPARARPPWCGQGQIGEIIAAKPQARRRILEDAAGIAGLHSRRHEAELRLQGAEDNLTRLEDVLSEIDGADREPASGRRGRPGAIASLASDIRRAEALLLLHRLARGARRRRRRPSARSRPISRRRRPHRRRRPKPPRAPGRRRPCAAGAARGRGRRRRGAAAADARPRRARRRGEARPRARRASWSAAAVELASDLEREDAP